MGRSPKVGLDYFPMDVHMDDKLELIEAQFGVKGFAVVVKLWQRIYAERGYYCEWDEDIALVFSARLPGMNANVVSDILCASIRRQLFDKDLFEKYGILTSRGIQKRYFEAVARREQVDAIQEYLLVSCGVLPKNVNIYSISASNNPVSYGMNAQSKGKDSIVKESIGKEILCTERAETGPSAPTPSAFDILLNDGTTYNVPMENIEVYKRLYPGIDVEQQLRNMVGWSLDAGPKRKTRQGVKKFITKWLIREQNNASRQEKPRDINPTLDYEQRDYNQLDEDSFFLDLESKYAGKEGNTHG